MKSKNFLFFVSMYILVLFISSCSNNPDLKANKIYTEVSQSLKKSKEESLSYSDFFSDYLVAKKNLAKLLTKFPSSDVAVQLTSQNLEVFNMPFDEFSEWGYELQQLSDAEKKPLDCARLITNSIEDTSKKAIHLMKISNNYIAQGKDEIATKIFNQVYNMVITSRDDFEVSDLLQIIEELIKVEQKAMATDLLDVAFDQMFSIDSDYNLVESFSRIGYLFSLVGQLDQVDSAFQYASMTYETIDSDMYKLWATYDMIRYLVLIKQYKQAYELAIEHDKNLQRDRLLQFLSYQLIANEEVSIAISYTKEIQSSFCKCQTLLKIAKNFMKNNHNELSINTLNKAEKISNSINDKENLVSTKIEIATLYDQLEMNDNARNVLLGLIEIAKKIDDPLKQLDLATQVASLQMKKGSNGEIDNVISEYLELSISNSDPYIKSQMLIKLANNCIGFKDSIVVDSLLTIATETTKGIKDFDHKMKIYRDISGVYATIKNNDSANRVLDIALMSVNEEDKRKKTINQDDYHRSSYDVTSYGHYNKYYDLTLLSQEFLKIEEYNKAKKVIKAIDDNRNRSIAYQMMSQFLANIGHFDESIQTALLIDQFDVRKETLINVLLNLCENSTNALKSVKLLEEIIKSTKPIAIYWKEFDNI